MKTVSLTSELQVVVRVVEEQSLFAHFARAFVEHVLLLPEEASAFVSEGYMGSSIIVERMKEEMLSPQGEYLRFYRVLSSQFPDHCRFNGDQFANLLLQGWEGASSIVEALYDDTPNWHRRPIVDLMNCLRHAGTRQ